ncbi:MAG: hypothetical protein ACPKPY_06815 [Nitrososphaeraceae archaeon]
MEFFNKERTKNQCDIKFSNWEELDSVKASLLFEMEEIKKFLMDNEKSHEKDTLEDYRTLFRILETNGLNVINNVNKYTINLLSRAISDYSESEWVYSDDEDEKYEDLLYQFEKIIYKIKLKE